jgi:hypothetical protein
MPFRSARYPKVARAIVPPSNRWLLDLLMLDRQSRIEGEAAGVSTFHPGGFFRLHKGDHDAR